MRYSESDKLSTPADTASTLEDRLREENQELRRQIQELRGASHHGAPAKLWHPSGVTIGAILLGAGVLIVIAFSTATFHAENNGQVVSEAR